LYNFLTQHRSRAFTPGRRLLIECFAHCLAFEVDVSTFASLNNLPPPLLETRMALIAPYSHQVFCDLDGPRQQHLRHKKVADMGPLRDVFKKYEMQNMCGLALLHRHYAIEEGEMLVEKINSVNSATMPMKAKDAPKVVPHLWKFYRGKWYPCEFLDVSVGHEKLETAISFSEKVSTNEPFLLELSQVLVAMGVQNLYGLQTNHRDIFLRTDPTDTVLETTDVPARLSSIVVIPWDKKQPEYFTDTFFAFNCDHPEKCPHHHPCGWTACAYGCCSDYDDEVDIDDNIDEDDKHIVIA